MRSFSHPSCRWLALAAMLLVGAGLPHWLHVTVVHGVGAHVGVEARGAETSCRSLHHAADAGDDSSHGTHDPHDERTPGEPTGPGQHHDQECATCQMLSQAVAAPLLLPSVDRCPTAHTAGLPSADDIMPRSPVRGGPSPRGPPVG